MKSQSNDLGSLTQVPQIRADNPEVLKLWKLIGKAPLLLMD